jgi:hypothetical protein
MTSRVTEELALRSALGLVQASNDDPDELALVAMIDDFYKGASLADLMKEPDAQGAGRFGGEILASSVLLVLLPALQAFWSEYIAKVTSGLADRAADLTVSRIERLFAEDLKTDNKLVLIAKIKSQVSAAADAKGLNDSDIAELLKCIDDTAATPAAVPEQGAKTGGGRG